MGWRDIALVAVGGALGSVMRLLVGRLVGAPAAAAGGWPWQTFLVNTSGAFAIGLLVVAAARLGFPGWWRPLVAIGVLGGFTTFSTFSLEIVENILTGETALAASYAALSVAAGVGGCLVGVLTGRALF